MECLNYFAAVDFQKIAGTLKPVPRSGFDGEMISKAAEGVQSIKISQQQPDQPSAPMSPKLVPNNIHLQNNNPDEGSRTPSGVRNQQESTFSIAGGDCKSLDIFRFQIYRS